MIHKSKSIYCIFLFICIFLVLFAYEVFCRVTRPRIPIQFDPEVGWIAAPNAHFNHSWGSETTNSLGFRSEEINPDFDHIVLMGDSVIWGFKVDDKKIASYLLNQNLNSQHIQVLNLGVSGYAIDQSYLLLKRHIQKINHLRYVILIICSANDYPDTTANAAYLTRKPFLTLKDGVLVSTRVKKYSLKNLLSRSYVARALYQFYWFRRIVWSLTGDKMLPESEGQEMMRVLFKNIQSTVRANGARFLVLVSPSVVDLNQKTEKLLWWEQFLKDEGYIQIPFYPILKQKSNFSSLYISDNVHLSAEGHILLADQILQVLADQ